MLVKSLPCSICLVNDASVHPAVTGGLVSLELASVFIPPPPGASSRGKKRILKRDCSKGRWLTEESEVKRKRDVEETEKVQAEEKEKKKEEKEGLKRHQEEQKEEKKKQIKAQRRIKQEAAQLALKEKKEEQLLKRRKAEEINNAKEDIKVGRVGAKGRCLTCKAKVPCSVKCLICHLNFHATCIGNSDAFIVCKLCSVL